MSKCAAAATYSVWKGMPLPRGISNGSTEGAEPVRTAPLFRPGIPSQGFSATGPTPGMQGNGMFGDFCEALQTPQ